MYSPICFTLNHTHIPFHNPPELLACYEWFTLRNFVKALVCDLCLNAVNEGRGGYYSFAFRSSCQLVYHNCNEIKTQGCWFQSNSSWLGSLIGTVIGNLKLSITNIHIRYEDEERCGHISYMQQPERLIPTIR